MSTARFRQHFQRKLLPILRIDREFSERRRNSFLFSRPWGRWWGRIGGFFVPTCANSCSLLLTRAIPPNRWKQRKSPGTSTKFRDYLWSSGGTCRTRAGSRSPFVGGARHRQSGTDMRALVASEDAACSDGTDGSLGCNTSV